MGNRHSKDKDNDKQPRPSAMNTESIYADPAKYSYNIPNVRASELERTAVSIMRPSYVATQCNQPLLFDRGRKGNKKLEDELNWGH